MGGQISYSLSECYFCKKLFSSNGLVQTQHRRKHCRENLTVEIQHKQHRYYSHAVDVDNIDLKFWKISHWQQNNPNDKVLEKYPSLKKNKKLGTL